MKTKLDSSLYSGNYIYSKQLTIFGILKMKGAFFSIVALLAVFASTLAGPRPSFWRLDDCRTPSDLQSRFIKSCLNRAITLEICNKGWNAFLSAFAGKDPNNVTLSDYTDYFEVFPVMPKKSSTLFWSGTYFIAEEIANDSRFKGIFSSFNLVASEIINNLVIGGDACWCGDPKHGGILYNATCPNNSATVAFWAEFSVQLGNHSGGVVFWLANGERSGGTYQPTNFFGLYEFPNLRPGVVTRLVVIDIHRKSIGEACGVGSLISLKSKSVAKFGSNGYGCYEVEGNVQMPKTVNLTDVLNIISKEREGIQKNVTVLNT